MEQRKILLALLLIVMAFSANAQIKVHSNNQISLGSLNTNYGVQILPTGLTTFSLPPNSNTAWITQSITNNVNSRSWLVSHPDPNIQYFPQHRFYVTGSGIVYRVGEYTISDGNIQSFSGNIENASDIVEQMNGFYYSFIESDKSNNERMLGMCAQDVEKILPEAVSKNDDGFMYLNYESITVLLVEAVKEQHKEIQRLNGILEANGLIK